MLESNNKLVKQIIKQNYQRSSKFKMIIRVSFYFILAVSLFFIWDAYKNKSVYTNSAKKELKKYGLLEPIQNLTDSVYKLYLNLQSSFNYYFPIWYRKTYQTVAPITKSAWDFTTENSKLAWTKTEPFRQSVVLYYNEAIKYVEVNFPVVVKNLVSVFELVINYFTTLTNLFIEYSGYFMDFIGKLLGWKQGQFKQVFLDAFKVLIAQITHFFEYLNKLSEEPQKIIKQKAAKAA